MSYQDLSDDALADACQRDEGAAWAELYRRHGPTLARFLRRLLGPGDDLDDVLQQVFVACYTSIAKFRGDAKLTTWLYRVASNVGSQHIRTQSRRRRRQQALVQGSLEAPEHSPGAHGVVEARQALEALDVVLAGLKPKHRTVWVMREVEHLSLDEIADALGVRQGTVRSRLLTARRKVVEGLDRAGHEAPGKTARFVGATAAIWAVVANAWGLGGMT